MLTTFGKFVEIPPNSSTKRRNRLSVSASIKLTVDRERRRQIDGHWMMAGQPSSGRIWESTALNGGRVSQVRWGQKVSPHYIDAYDSDDQVPSITMRGNVIKNGRRGNCSGPDGRAWREVSAGQADVMIPSSENHGARDGVYVS